MKALLAPRDRPQIAPSLCCTARPACCVALHCQVGSLSGNAMQEGVAGCRTEMQDRDLQHCTEYAHLFSAHQLRHYCSRACLGRAHKIRLSQGRFRSRLTLARSSGSWVFVSLLRRRGRGQREGRQGESNSQQDAYQEIFHGNDLVIISNSSPIRFSRRRTKSGLFFQSARPRCGLAVRPAFREHLGRRRGRR